MAVRFDAAADRLLRTANLPSYDANYTVCFWFYFPTRPGNNVYFNLWQINDNTNDTDYLALVGQSGVDTRLSVGFQEAGAFVETIGSTNLSPNTWYCVGLIRSANNSRVGYIGTATTSLASQATNSTSTTGRTAPTRMEFGAGTSGNSDPYNGRIANIKVWTVARTLAELQNEQYSVRPLFFSNLHIWTPALNGSGERARDYSGNGYNWTESGTLTDEDGPPIGWGSPPIVFPFAAAASRTGAAAITLGTLTSSAAGTLPIAGAASNTLGALTLSSAAVIALRAAASNTLGTLTSSAAGTLPIAGAASNTLGALTLASAGTLASGLTGDASITLGALTSSAAGTLPIAGAASPTLGALTLSAAAVISLRAAASNTLGALTLAATGLSTKQGILAATLGALVTNNGAGLRVYGGGNASNVDKIYIPCNPADAINVGQADFTIEFWVKADPTNPNGTATAGANYSWINSPILFDRDILGSLGSGGDWGLSITDGRLTFGIENSAGSQRTIIGSTNIRDNVWHHVAITRVRSSGDMAIYLDGVREANQAGGPSGDVHIASNSAASTYNRYMCLGGEKHAIDWTVGQFIGQFDEIRVSNSIRYTGTTYTVPSAPFAADANTVGLFHLDEGTGTTVADSSGNGNNGSFTTGGANNGPTWIFTTAFLGAAGVLAIQAAASPTMGALTLSSAAVIALRAAASNTLGALTSSAAGTLPIAGAASNTLGALTLVSTGSAGTTGVAAITLGTLTSSAAGTLPIAGAASNTLGALTLASAGTLAIQAAASYTLGALTLAATGGGGQLGIAVITLGTLTSSAAGTLPIVGAASNTMGALTSNSAGTLPIAGAASSTLGALALASAGTLPIAGAASNTLGALTSSSDGALAIQAAASNTLGALVLTATGSRGVMGAADITLGVLTLSGSGSILNLAVITVVATVYGVKPTGTVSGMISTGAVAGVVSTGKIKTGV